MIREENERRQQALDLQEKLAEAEIRRTDAAIKLIEAQARKIAAGDDEISISFDANGVEPAIEFILFEIMKQVQAKVAADQAAFLQGLNITTVDAA